MPVSGKNYATLKDFIDNTPKIQQKEFWKHTAEVANRCMTEKGKVWISVTWVRCLPFSVIHM